MLKYKQNKILLSALLSSLFVSNITNAIEITKDNQSISFDLIQQNNYQLVLVSPDKKRFTFDVADTNFTLAPSQIGLDAFSDGMYKYEFIIKGSTNILGKEVRSLNNPAINEEFINSFSTKSEDMTGVFTLFNSAIVDSDEGESETRDFTINDDLIVDGSACIGFDCVDGESFGFDTLRLKENNLRIKFDDTSVAASFPNNDWQLTANDSANGGTNKFSIDDITGGTTPFTVEAGARSHSLYVDDGGRIGIRTSTPSTEIHVVDGDTPTLRLQQDGSSGFAPQTWDVAGNETSFFIRDVTNGSTLPFRIRPDAPTSSLDIAADGDIGLGTSSPEKNLHIRGSGTVTALLDSTDGAVQFRLRTDTENRRILARNAADTTQTQIVMNNNNVKIAGETDTTNLFATFDGTGLTVNGSISTTASGQVHPDYVFKKDYKLMPLSDVKSFINENSHLPDIPSEKDVAKNGYNMTEIQILLLKKVEELTLYTLAQQELIENMDSEIATLKKQD